MKITFNTPDLNAPEEVIERAIAIAQSAFLLAMSEEGESSLQVEMVEQSPRTTCLPSNGGGLELNSSLASSLNFGHPSPEQLAKMNLLRPLGASEYKANEVVSVAYVASNNLVWHFPDNCAWSPNALQNMAEQYVNRPMTCDHDWWNVNLVSGVIYDAEVRKSDRVSESIIARANRDINLKIFQQEGYQELILYVMYEAKSAIVNDIRFRRMGDVSTGGMVDITKYKCPHDGSYFGEGEDDFTCAEGHKLPHPMLIQWFYDDDELENLAEYYQVDVVTDSVELSHVLVGNLAAAQLIKAS